jgi:hypothetical protein
LVGTKQRSNPATRTSGLCFTLRVRNDGKGGKVFYKSCKSVYKLLNRLLKSGLPVALFEKSAIFVEIFA